MSLKWNHKVTVTLCGSMIAILTILVFHFRVHLRVVENSRPIYNVILISVDTLAAKHLALYGGRVKTPNLESMARESSFFANSFSTASYTFPSHVSIFTGLNFATHGLSFLRSESRYPSLEDGIKTLPEILQEHGYETVWCAVTNDSQLDLKRGLERGFRHFLKSTFRTFLNQECSQFIADAPHQPFFIFNHSYLVHDPYTPTKPFYGRVRSHQKSSIIAEEGEFNRWLNKRIAQHQIPPLPYDVPSRKLYFSQVDFNNKADVEELESLYDESILEMDAKLGEYIDLLKTSGLWEHSIVIFTSDHGEAFGEHGEFMHKTVHQEILEVPLIIHVPNLGPQVRHEFVQSPDLLPTVTDLLGFDLPNPVDGQSLYPLLKGEPWTPRPFIYAQEDPLKSFSVFNADWSLVLDQGDAPPELYDFRRDRFQKQNLAHLHPEVAQRLVSWGRQFQIEARARAGEITKSH